MTKAGTLLCAMFLSAGTLVAQSKPGPVPAAILTAKTLFLSNGGGDAGLFPQPFSGDPSRGYSELYAALQASGQYQLVDDPSKADLVLEVRLTAPYGPSRGSKVQGASDPLPMFTLAIVDQKTHYTLWTLTRMIDYAFLQKTHDRNFDDAVTTLASQFEALTGKQPAAPAATTP